MTTRAKYPGCNCSHTEVQRGVGVGVGVGGGDKAEEQQQLQSGSHDGLQSINMVLGNHLRLLQWFKTPNS